jgi:hypothetical protein
MSWSFGFSWIHVVAIIACGVGITHSDGWVRWLLYVPFLLLGLHMSIRFRSFSTQPWRRVHARTMAAYGPLAVQEYEAAKKSNREFDIHAPCRSLSEQVFGHDKSGQWASLLAEGRKAYYKNLVDSYPQVFAEGVSAAQRDTILGGVRRDVDASQLGPDIVIAKKLELEQGGLEAARYLHALLLGRVR